MKNASNVENAGNENVIEISFGAPSHEISHPASKRYPEESELEDDPLEALLAEGMLEEPEEELSGVEDYIHAHQKPLGPMASYENTASELASSALERIARLKEDAKRIRYYLDELDID